MPLDLRLTADKFDRLMNLCRDLVRRYRVCKSAIYVKWTSTWSLVVNHQV